MEIDPIRWNQLLLAANFRLQQVYPHLHTVAADLGLAYKEAWDQMNTTLKEVERRRQLTAQIVSTLFSAFLLGAGGKILEGVFAGAMKSGPLIAGSVDLAKAADQADSDGAPRLGYGVRERGRGVCLRGDVVVQQAGECAGAEPVDAPVEEVAPMQRGAEG